LIGIHLAGGEDTSPAALSRNKSTINSTICRTFGNMITANDIKTRGVKAIEDGLSQDDRLSITVRGRVKYVVLKAEDYESLRLAEMEMAYQQVVKDIGKEEYTIETADQHMNRLWKKEKKSSK
jgi:PHD/YefM family antitoxin component YafN of YafNO toxin-antitoxin module